MNNDVWDEDATAEWLYEDEVGIGETKASAQDDIIMEDDGARANSTVTSMETGTWLLAAMLINYDLEWACMAELFQ